MSQEELTALLLAAGADPTVIEKILSNLSPEERVWALQSFKEMIEQGSSPTLEALYTMDFVRRPVDIETFVKDKFYLGNTCDNIYDAWVDELNYVFAPNSGIYEWILTGCIGGGKTWVASIAQLYKLYVLSCVRSINQFLTDGILAEKGPTYFGIYALDVRTAEDNAFTYMKTFVDNSPYFNKYFSRYKKRNDMLRFPQDVTVKMGSSELHSIGRNLLCVLLDELNFMQGGAGDQGQAYRLYNSVRARLVSRYLINGKLPGLMCLVSSRRASTDWLEKHMETVRNDAHVHISDFAIWEVKPPEIYSGKTFRVAIGDRFRPSRILKAADPIPEAQTILDVPVEHKLDFERNIDQAIREFAGKPTYTISNYLTDRSKITKCATSKLPHPFSKEVIELDYREDTPIGNWFLTDTVCKVFDSRYRPRLNPLASRFVHVDLAINGDCAGIAMGHMSGWDKQDRPIKDALKYRVEAAKITIDFVLRIKAATGSEIDISAIREFIVFLRKNGFLVEKATYDGFQSRSSIQDLVKVGLNSEWLSVDVKREPYEYLWTFLMDERISYYGYQPFMEEVAHLRRVINPKTNKVKVDHPEEGSKDCSDAVAGVVYNVLESVQTGQPGLPVRATEGTSVMDHIARYEMTKDGVVTGVVVDGLR